MLNRIRSFLSNGRHDGLDDDDAPTPELVDAWDGLSRAWVGLSVAYLEVFIASDGELDAAREASQMALERANIWNSRVRYHRAEG